MTSYMKKQPLLGREMTQLPSQICGQHHLSSILSGKYPIHVVVNKTIKGKDIFIQDKNIEWLYKCKH